MLASVGMGSIPVIVVVDSDLGGNRTLLLRHEYDGRDLQLDFADRTLAHVRALWGRDVALDTVLDGEPRRLLRDCEGLTVGAAG
jgi:stage V sporulation protein R